MLKDLFGDRNTTGGVQTAVVTENMLDGYYRVTASGLTYTARNQSGKTLPAGAIVSVASTILGRFIVSTAAKTARKIPTVIVRG